MDDMAGTPILTGTTPIDSSEGIELETIATAANNDEESHDDRSESHGESLTTTSNESRVESLTASNEENDNTSSSQLRKELTLLDTISLVISQTIGAGIFITATQVFRYSGSVGLTLIIWFVGGLLSFAGGLTFIELGLLIKTSGGEYDYLREGYTFSKNRPVFLFIGNILSFSFSWYTILITRPASIAITTLSFGQYLAQAIAGGATPPDTAVKLLAISAISEFCLKSLSQFFVGNSSNCSVQYIQPQRDGLFCDCYISRTSICFTIYWSPWCLAVN